MSEDENIRCINDCPPNGRARKRSRTARIIAIGLDILRIPLSIKYGMRPWSRLSEASVSDAESEATNSWKIVAANLDIFFI